MPKVAQDKWHVKRYELVDFIKKNFSTIDAQLNMPICPKEKIYLGKNLYNLKEYIQWYINVFMNQSGKADEMAAEKLRHEKYKADKAMYEAEERAENLLNKDFVLSSISLIISGTKRKFLSWIKRLPPLLAHKSASEIEIILKEELYKILSDLAKGMNAIIPKKRKESREKKEKKNK